MYDTQKAFQFNSSFVPSDAIYRKFNNILNSRGVKLAHKRNRIGRGIRDSDIQHKKDTNGLQKKDDT